MLIQGGKLLHGGSMGLNAKGKINYGTAAPGIDAPIGPW
jgi:hypothetical protein